MRMNSVILIIFYKESYHMIHKYIAALLLIAGYSTSSFADIVKPVVISNIDGRKHAMCKSAMPIEAQMTNQSDAETTAKITVSVLTDNTREQDVQAVFAMSAEENSPRLYKAEKSGGTYDINVVPGTYDIVVYIASDNENTQILLFKEDVEVTSQKAIIINQREATISTDIRRIAPSGVAFKLPSIDDPGNSSISDNLLLLRHNEAGTVFRSENAAFRDVGLRISVNLIPKRFSLTRMDVYSWEGGPAYMVIPVDFSKEVNGPDGKGWAYKQLSFAQTPLNKAYNLTRQKPFFNMTGYFVMSDNQCNTFIGMGNDNHEFPIDRIHYWVPEDYDGYYAFLPLVRENMMEAFDAAVSSMPYKMTSQGLVPVGLNFIGNNRLMIKDGCVPTQGHPRFSYEPEDNDLLCNAVPALVCVPVSTEANRWLNGFNFSFKGRYGENLGINTYNFFEDVDKSTMLNLGGYRRDISVRCDDREICSSPDEFVNWINWGSGEKYTCSMQMYNVLIDDQIDGVNKAALTYLASDGYIPTLTHLQMCDSNGKITDRFVSPLDARIELSAATFLFKSMIGNDFYDFKAPSNVIVEYALHGADSFKPLTVVERPEYFFLPGYGNYYEVSLDEMQSPEDNQWYDLRVTVEGVPGAKQVQTLSPAFKLDKSNAIELNANDESTKNALCDVYAPDGVLVARNVSSASESSLRPGIYVEVRDGKARKVAVR